LADRPGRYADAHHRRVGCRLTVQPLYLSRVSRANRNARAVGSDAYKRPPSRLLASRDQWLLAGPPFDRADQRMASCWPFCAGMRLFLPYRHNSKFTRRRQRSAVVEPPHDTGRWSVGWIESRWSGDRSWQPSSSWLSCQSRMEAYERVRTSQTRCSPASSAPHALTTVETRAIESLILLLSHRLPASWRPCARGNLDQRRRRFRFAKASPRNLSAPDRSLLAPFGVPTLLVLRGV